MITAKEINDKLKAAIKEFGEYSYFDKGASEIMDVESIAQKLYEIEDVYEIVNVLEDLTSYRDTGILLREIVGILMENYEESFSDELAEKGGELVADYY